MVMSLLCQYVIGSKLTAISVLKEVSLGLACSKVPKTTEPVALILEVFDSLFLSIDKLPDKLI